VLTLSRKPGETIRIGDDVLIVIRKATRGRVTIAVDAPQGTAIVRGELTADQDQDAATERRTACSPR
jgi:carbon storage regulator CsrA